VLAESDQSLTKKLAEIKSFLQKRIRQQEDEITTLRSFLDVVDSLLAERSFRRVELRPAEARPRVGRAPPSEGAPILTTDGVRIASLQIEQNTLHVFPDANVKLDSNSPPLRSFLIGKILDPMQSKDKESAASGTIPPENILSYELDQEDGELKAIHIQNYGDDRRLLELKNAIRWTLRRMYEKSSTRKT